MVKSFYLQNFLSWLNATIELNRTNLIVGNNNSGKSNLCRALQFLSLSASNSLNESSDILGIPRQQIGNVSQSSTEAYLNVKVELLQENGSPILYDYGLEVRIPKPKAMDPTIEVYREVLLASWDGWKDLQLLAKTRDKVSLLHEGDLEQRRDIRFVETTSPNDSTMLSRLYDLQTNIRANRFKKYLQSWQFYDLSHQGLRNPSYKPFETVLNIDGSNLSSVVYDLRNRNERAYRKLLKTLQQLEPEIEFIDYSGGGTTPNVFMFFDYKSGAKLPGWTASSGTLRFLALSYILMFQPSSIDQPLTIIEEPENGLHVSHLRRVVEMAESEKCKTQTIFTSHAPYFIDLFDTNLESVLAAESSGHVSKIRSIDANKAREMLETMPLGEQYFRRSL